MTIEMRKSKIPQTTISRLPVYLRVLSELANKKAYNISSYELAELVGGNPARLRKDLSYLGEFGTRGVGYDVEHLIYHISKSLGLTKAWSVAIVGIGRMGTALEKYWGFKISSFKVIGLFDKDPKKIGKKVNDLTVLDIEEIEEEAKRIGKIDIGIITTPASAAQEAVDKLVKAGVKAILNYAPVSIEVPEGVLKSQVDILLDLQILSFHLAAQG